MPSIFDVVTPHEGCVLTVLDNPDYENVIQLQNGDPPVESPNVAGPFEKTIERGSSIECVQNWRDFRIDVQRDLLRDVVTELLNIIAAFNPRSLSGVEAVVDALVGTKDRLITLIQEGVWSIRQNWRWRFDNQGGGQCLVVPGVFGTAWRDDDYFSWSVEVTTRLNGGMVAEGHRSADADRGEREVHRDPPKPFPTTLNAGANTVQQTVKLNVYFIGYEEELQAALDLLESIADEAGRALQDLEQQLQQKLMELANRPQSERDEARRVHEQNMLDLDRRVKARADRAKTRTHSAIQRLRRHRSRIFMSESTFTVICASQSVAEMRKLIEAGQQQEQEERHSNAATGLLERAETFLATGPRVRITAPGVAIPKVAVAPGIIAQAVAHALPVVRRKTELREELPGGSGHHEELHS